MQILQAAVAPVIMRQSTALDAVAGFTAAQLQLLYRPTCCNTSCQPCTGSMTVECLLPAAHCHLCQKDPAAAKLLTQCAATAAAAATVHQLQLLCLLAELFWRKQLSSAQCRPDVSLSSGTALLAGTAASGTATTAVLLQKHKAIEPDPQSTSRHTWLAN
jgi:hypothetical protein